MLLAAFLFLGIFYIASWGVMFYSLVFRWTFASWPFFASLTVAAFVMLIASCVLGVVCWRNFDKGLAHFRMFEFAHLPFLPFELTPFVVAVYVDDVLSKENFQPGLFTNNSNDVERPSFDSMCMITSEGTKFVVASNAVHL